MIFTSLIYPLFLFLTFAVTFTLPAKLRTGFLLIASYTFYMYWKPSYAFVILGLTLIDYLAGLAIGSTSSEKRRRVYWLASLAGNLSVLFVFKYLGFFATELNHLMSWWNLGTPLQIPLLLLPIGVSFHTLQAISYSTDVYRGVAPAERDFLKFALFIAWFPQMVAGPIERASTLLVQIGKFEVPTAPILKSAGWLLLWGLFKKLVVADNLGILVDQIYAEPASFPPYQVWLAMYGFAFQLYCDFSAYTDLARGSSLLFSIRLSENFDRPFLAKSIPEFWRRWHITLWSWFFEYVYYPMVRMWPGRIGPWTAVFTVFILSGLWHGANWTYLLWGLLHALFYSLYLLFPSRTIKERSSLENAVRIFLTFNIVCLCWVVFRASNLPHAGEILRSLLAILPPLHEQSVRSVFHGPQYERAGAICGLVILSVYAWCERFLWKDQPQTKSDRVVLAGVLILSLLTFGRFSGQTFIYFQF